MANYTVVLPLRRYARFLEAVAAAESRMLTDRGRTPAERQRDAEKIRRAFNQYERELKLLARDTARLAEREIKRLERTTRVRPDTAGEGGSRLNRGIGKSRALPVIPGSVGINDDEWAMSHGVAWWWTNEWGYSGHIGRVVHGFFYDTGGSGRAAPGAQPSRSQPLFRPEGFQRAPGYRQLDSSGAAFHKRSYKRPKGGRPGMLISNPIPARRFVREGALVAERRWHIEVERARQHFLRQIVGL